MSGPSTGAREYDATVMALRQSPERNVVIVEAETYDGHRLEFDAHKDQLPVIGSRLDVRVTW